MVLIKIIMAIKIKINKVIKYLVLSDLIFWSAWGLITPVFAIFIVENIEGGNVLVVGLSSAIYSVLMAVLRIPFGMILDKKSGEKDDYLFLILGLFIAALVPFGFIFSKTPMQVYLLQAIHAIGMAMSLSAWPAIFTRHIDKGKESTEWGIDATAIGLGTGIFGAIGGWAVTAFGFNPVFISVGVLGLAGVAVLLGLKGQIKKTGDHALYFGPTDIYKND